MKTKTIILLPFLYLNILWAGILGLSIDIEVQLLPTAQFNLADWDDPNISLWLVTIQNKTDTTKMIYIEFRMEAHDVSGLPPDVDQPITWGVTDEIEIPPFQTKVLYNADFTKDEMWTFEISTEFKNIVETNGYLPAGNYDMKMIAWRGLSSGDLDGTSRQVFESDENEILDISWDHNYVTPGGGYNDDWNWESEKGQSPGDILGNTLVSTITLEEPVYEADVADPYPWFRWRSPGFRSGVIIDYRIKVAQFNPDLHSSELDALEDANLTFFDTEWNDEYSVIYHIEETGNEQLISIQFPSGGDRDLACGYKYVWQVEARDYLSDEILDDFGMEGLPGVWGWPEPVKSEYRVFNYGSKITQDKISSPIVGGVESTVRPNFTWDQVGCAEEYEIWLSDVEDPEVENPLWQSEPIQSIPFQYPLDASGFMPGKSYFWKVRINPNSEPSPWSEIVSYSIEPMSLTEPAIGEVLTTVLPTFNANVPNDIAAFELRISDQEDETVDMANVFNEIITGLPYQFPTDVLQGLSPGETYYWKLMVLDANENLVGTLEDYTEVGNFSIASINLLTPSHQESDLPLNPIFSWEGPLGVPSYEFRLSDEEDPEIENPLFTTIVNGTFFQYPLEGDYPLEYTSFYYWTVVPLDGNENPGSAASLRKFSTMARPLEPAPDLTVSLTGPRSVQFSFPPVANTEVYHLMISETNEVDEEQLLSDRLWEIEDLTLTTANLTPDEYELEYSTQYYTQVVAMKDALTHSLPSEIVSFTTLELPGSLDRPEITVDLSISDPCIPIITLIEDVTDATGYIFSISNDPSMENIIIESDETNSFPFVWEDACEFLSYNSNYYIRVIAYKDGEPHGLPGEVISLNIPEEPGVSDTPEIQVTVSPTAPLSPTISFTRVENSESARIILSNNNEVADNGVLVNIIWEVSGIIQTSITVTENDILLEYNTNYYSQVISERNGELFGNPSETELFTTGERLGATDQVQISITTSPTDSRIPIISLISSVAGATSYSATIAEDAEMGSVILTVPDVTTFPIELTQGVDLLQYESTYYVQVSAYVDGELHGLPSDAATFVIGALPGTSSKPEFTTTFVSEDSKGVIVTLVSTVEGATDYLVSLAMNQDMTDVFIQETVPTGSFPYTVDPSLLDWGMAYYMQLQGTIEGEFHGLASNVQMVNTPPKPGSRDQVGIAVNIETGSFTPTIEIANPVSGATGYIISVSLNQEMSDVLWESDPTTSLVITYPSDAPALSRGEIYYFQAHAIDEEGPHGIPSTVVTLFVPNIIPPVLNDELFLWEATVPAAESYRVEVSLTEDFTSVVLSETVQLTNFPFSMDYFEWGTSYYWRVQGLDADGSFLGVSSSVGFFQTESVLPTTLNSPIGGSETSLFPEFSWVNVEQAAEYLIEVAQDDQFDNIVWSATTEAPGILYSESATHLNNNSSYFWRISTLKTDGTILSISAVESFVTSSVFAVTGLTPDGSAVDNLTPTLAWNKNPDSYLIEIATDADFSNIIVSEVIETGEFTVPEGILSEGTTYYWRVDGLSADGGSLAGPSEIATFVTPEAEQVSLISPVGTEVNSLNPTLKWSALAGAASYNLDVATDDNFGSILFSETMQGTEKTIPEEFTLINAATYFWRVEALNSDGAPIGNPSDIGSFSTPPAITLNILALADGVNISTTSPAFSWEAVEGVATYLIQFAPNSDFSESWELQTGSTQFSYSEDAPPFEIDHTYFWRLRPLNNEGGSIGDWTETRRFTFTSAYIVQLESPGNGADVTTALPTFQWEQIEDAAKYEILVSANEDFSEIVWQSDNIVENSTQYPSSGAEPLDFNTEQTYFWKVRALGEDSPLGDFSSVFNFHLSAEYIPQLTNPVNSETESLNPFFTWENVENVHHYGITVSSNEEFTQIIHESDASESQYEYPQTGVPPLDWETTYWWRVIALDEAGNPMGDPSQIASFTTPSGEIVIDFFFSGLGGD